jgi:hypothetical protein
VHRILNNNRFALKEFAGMRTLTQVKYVFKRRSYGPNGPPRRGLPWAESSSPLGA